VTPVKSTALHHPDALQFEMRGPVGDRRFFVVGADGRRLPRAVSGALLPVQAAYRSGSEILELQMPDGLRVSGSAKGAGDALEVDFFGRTVRARTVLGPFDAALSAFLGRDARLARTEPDSDAWDVHPVTIVSLESVREIAVRGGRADGDLNPGRFRMTIEVKGVSVPHSEDGWTGRMIRIGGALLRIGRPVNRCVITTLDPATGLPDFPTLRIIEGYRGVVDHGLSFGMYAQVVAPGYARLGDQVELR